jgi:hypothetical protein
VTREKHLSAQHRHEVLHVGPDEGILQDGLPIAPQNPLKFGNVALLVRLNKPCNRLNLRLVSVRLRLLSVERVHPALHQHAC